MTAQAAAVAQMQVRPPHQPEYVALGMAVKEGVLKAAKEQLPEGVTAVDFTLRIYGHLKKGAPFDMTTPMTIPWQTLFGLALSRLNKTTGKTIEELANELLVETAEGIKRDPDAMEAANNKIKPHVEKVCQRLIEGTRRPCQGRITSVLNLVVLPAVTDKVTMPPGAFQAAVGDADVPPQLAT